MKNAKKEPTIKLSSRQAKKLSLIAAKIIYGLYVVLWSITRFGQYCLVMGAIESADKIMDEEEHPEKGHLSGQEGHIFYVIGKPIDNKLFWWSDEGWEDDIEIALQFEEEENAKEHAETLPFEMRPHVRIYAVQATYTYEAGRPLDS